MHEQAVREYQLRVEQAVARLQEWLPEAPQYGVILGTGLRSLVDELEDRLELQYVEIPGFPASTAPGHRSCLYFGRIRGRPVVAFEGRFHVYEGYDVREITMPARLLGRFGTPVMVITNAGGGMNPDHQRGDLMILDDHINLLGVNPLTGLDIEEWGPRFPDMSEPYDRELVNRMVRFAEELDVRAHTGVYVAVPGPSLETRAEYRMLRNMGADVVGMSTIPEVIVAAQEGMRCVGISVITDLCDPDNLAPVSVEDILAAAAEAEPRLTRLVRRLVEG